MSSDEGAGGPAVRVTMLTLARDLGVSRATVSNAYNRPDQLSAQLRERILTRAAELGFGGPDPLARGLRRGRVGAVGVLVDQALSYSFSDPATVQFLDGLAQEVQAEGFGLLLHAGSDDPGDLRPVRDAAVDAWVVQSLPAHHPAVAAAQAGGRPVVVLDQPQLPGAPLVGIDDAAGARLAVRHLVGLGHRRLAVLSMPLGPGRRQGPADLARQQGAQYQVMSRRLAGAAVAVRRAGLDWAQVPVLECAANDPEAGRAAAVALLAAPEPPTAVFALSDQLALGALRAAEQAGIAVPQQLSVVGFDDAPPARYTSPALTTVAQPLRERGAAVGRLVRALVAQQPLPAAPAFRVRLVQRASTGPPPG